MWHPSFALLPLLLLAFGCLPNPHHAATTPLGTASSSPPASADRRVTIVNAEGLYRLSNVTSARDSASVVLKSDEHVIVRTPLLSGGAALAPARLVVTGNEELPWSWSSSAPDLALFEAPVFDLTSVTSDALQLPAGKLVPPAHVQGLDAHVRLRIADRCQLHGSCASQPHAHAAPACVQARRQAQQA